MSSRALVFPVAALIAALGAFSAAPASAATSHVFSGSFGSKTSTPENPYPLSEPSAVAVDNSSGPSAHDIYVTDPGNHRVEKFSPAGQFILMFGKEVNKNGSTEAEQDVCTAEPGEECQPGAPGSTPGAFQAPAYLAVDSSNGPSAGDLYVADPATHLVQKFDPSGHIISSWGEAGQKDGSDTGSAANFENLWGVAVGITGKLYVLAHLGGGVFFENGPPKVYEYEQNGNHFATVGSSGGNLFEYDPGIAVDPTGNLYLVGLNAISETGVQKYDFNGQWIATVTSVEGVTGLTIDPSADELYQDTGKAIEHYRADCDATASCQPLDSFGGGDLSAAQGVAADATSHTVFVANSGFGEVAVFDDVRPQATTGPLSAGTQTSVTVTAHVDPAGHGSISTCEFEYGREKSYGNSVSCEQVAPYSGDVTATISGLPPGFRGHYRVVVSNTAGGTATGADESFTAAEPPSIDGLEAAKLTPTSAELIARVNPDDLNTTYRFEYGPTTAYGQVQPSPEPLIETELGRDHTVRLQLENLTPNIVYHYRLIAENQEGTTTSADNSFNFYPPSCPNATLRQQTGSDNLPDCRAYELVTPANSGNALIFPADATPNTGMASNPARLAYDTWGGAPPLSGNPINTEGDMYISTRTDQGWVSKYVGLPADQTFLMGGPPWAATNEIYQPSKWNRGVLANPSLSKVVDWNDGEYEGGIITQYNGEGEGFDSSNAPYVWDSTSGALLGRWPTDLGEVEGGNAFKGETIASADLSHFVFSSNLPFPVEEDEAAAAVKGAIYDNNTETGKTSVVSVNAEGKNIKAAPDKVSADGTHILMSTPAPACLLGSHLECPPPLSSPVQLHMRVDDRVTYEIAPGHLVNYVGITADASRVFFTSAEPLTSEDHDTSTDLYMWSQHGAEEEPPHPLTLISKGDNEGKAGDPGNTDACSAAPAGAPWNGSKCNVATLSFSNYARLQGGRGGNGSTDSSIASESGEVYFYSPEQLVGDRGIPGQENLYLYRDGALQFVTALTPGSVCNNDEFSGEVCSEGPIARMDVSPDGSHMAFVSNSRVTSYDNTDPTGPCELNENGEPTGSAHCTEMYSYVPASGKISCDSCLPNGGSPTSGVLASQNGLFMANDGRTFFSTENALTSADTNHNEDVYEFVDGRPQLISSGTTAGNAGNGTGFIGNQTGPGLVAVSANGTDVYFATFEILVGQDENGEELKIYDARTDGGFPFLPPPAACAAADECHGPGSSPPLTPADGTGVNLGSGGNVASEFHSKHHKSKRHHRKPTAKRHHGVRTKHGRGGAK